MNKKRKSTSLWAFENDVIYAFGGCQEDIDDVDVIERYIKMDDESDFSDNPDCKSCNNLTYFVLQ